MTPADLAGRRILIVEDEFFVALQLEQPVRAAPRINKATVARDLGRVMMDVLDTPP